MSKKPSAWSVAAVLSSACALVAGVESVAFAHARLDAPPARDNRDGYKDDTGGAPCGIGRTATQPSTTLAAGATVEVKWTETVNHPGCFLIDFATSGDANFQLLANVKHAATGGTPRLWTKSVTLPSTPCTGCTLRLRQIMLGNETAACPPATIARNASYYACANVTLTGGGGGDAGVLPPADAGAGTDGRTGSGGGTGSGGTSGSGGSGSGGSSASGGSSSTGGSNGSGGASASGGSTGTGGSPATGGSTGSGGTSASGGATASTGGSGPGSGGSSASGGATAVGTGGSTPAGTGGAGTSNPEPEPAACACTVSTAATWPTTGLFIGGMLLALALRRTRTRKRPLS